MWVKVIDGPSVPSAGVKPDIATRMLDAVNPYSAVCSAAVNVSDGSVTVRL